MRLLLITSITITFLHYVAVVRGTTTTTSSIQPTTTPDAPTPAGLSNQPTDLSEAANAAYRLILSSIAPIHDLGSLVQTVNGQTVWWLFHEVAQQLVLGDEATATNPLSRRGDRDGVYDGRPVDGAEAGGTVPACVTDRLS